MAQHNTHRAAGRAVSPIRRGLAVTSAGGAAVLGTLMLSSMGTAQAAPTPAAPVAPAAHVAPQAPAVKTEATKPSLASTSLPSGRTLLQGSTGSTVKVLQAKLNDQGAKLAVDGIFGPRTDNAVRTYQQDQGLDLVDGIVGPETRGSLNDGSSSTGGSSDSAPAAGGTSAGSTARSAQSSSTGSVLSVARDQIGTPYVWAGSNPGGFDCSGFTQYVYKQALGIDLPHSSSAQAAGGRSISQSEAKPGDLVVWPGHIGIYAGNGQVIDAGTSPHAVTERGMWGSPSFVTYR